MRSIPLFLFVTIVALVSCRQAPKMTPMSLLDYGVPLTLMIPDSAKVNHQKLGVEEDITIAGPDHFKMQIFIAPKTHPNTAELLAEQKELVKGGAFFSKITKEESDGLKYESKIDSTLTYGFRRVMVIGDKEIIVREALMGTFSKADIDHMYSALKKKMP